jgi:hypothetical protein
MVYVVHNNYLNLKPAEMFGEVRVLYNGTPPDLYNLSRHAGYIKTALKDSQPSDFIACTGTIILNILAAGIMMEKHGFINLLIYDMRSGVYKPKVLGRHQLMEAKHGGE